MRVHVASTGFHTSPVSHVCCACRRGIPAGVISYGSRVHEPHCEVCCKDWEKILLGAAMAPPRVTLCMEDFRAWQAQRARQAA